jgi:copper chaperone
MIEFRVNDMTCGHCVATVTKAVKAAEPAATVDIDLGTKRVRVDGTDARDKVEAAIREAGYTPQAA